MKEDKKNNINFRISVIVLCALFIAILWAVVGILAEEEPEEEVHISAIVENSNSSRWTAFRLGMERAAKDLVVDLNFVSTADWAGQEDAMELIQNKVSDGSEGIILEPFDSTISGKDLRQVLGDIPTVFVENKLEDDSADYTAFTPDYKEICQSIIVSLAEKCGDELEGKNVKIVTSEPNKSGIRQSIDILSQELEARGCKLMQTEVIDKQNPQNCINNNIIDIVIPLDDYALSQAAGEITSKKQSSHILIYGIGSGNATISYLRQGIIQNMILVNDYKMGYNSLSSLVNVIRYKKSENISETVDFRNISYEESHDTEIEKLLYPNIQ